MDRCRILSSTVGFVSSKQTHPLPLAAFLAADFVFRFMAISPVELRGR
jgi:hypothetical protein